MHSSIELLLVDLKFKHQTVTCGLYYRPPSSGVSDLHHLEATLEELPSSCSRSLLLLGDFNIDLLGVPQHPQLNSIMDKFGLKQVVSAPTRSTQNSATLIDHVYISDQLSCSSCTIQPPVHGSDHNAILLSLNRPQFATKKSSRRQVCRQQIHFCNVSLVTLSLLMMLIPCGHSGWTTL